MKTRLGLFLGLPSTRAFSARFLSVFAAALLVVGIVASGSRAHAQSGAAARAYSGDFSDLADAIVAQHSTKRQRP